MQKSEPESVPATRPLEARNFRADRGDAGQRLDLVLVRHLADRPEISRNQIQNWIDAGRVTIDGKAAGKAADRVPAGAEVSVLLPILAPRPAPEAEEGALEILYEDEHFLALNKPPGLVVHPNRSEAKGTLLNALLWRFRSAGEPGIPHLVQRLDRGTSGLLLVAKRPAMHAALAKALRAERAEKEYLAICYGRPPRSAGKINLRIDRHPTVRGRRVAYPADGVLGQESLTLFETVALGGGLSVVRCILMTGRTHQIRVHLAALGVPIVGDPLYGEPGWSALRDPELSALCRDLPRQALHAFRLRFVHPATRSPLALEAPLPDDLQKLVNRIGEENTPGFRLDSW
ncbi:MAG TPA: RluA family pseudouridine synthase [Thermoanaerobaculia bacterium]|nr:RluA family pseudouridine synthase [Thermoanaerobaculia bacterium]